MISGFSGVLAWLSAGRGTPLGTAAVILNFFKIFLLTPVFMAAVVIEAPQRTYEENRLFTIWAIVLFVQIAAVVVFIFNLVLDYVVFPYLEKKKHAANNAVRPAKVGISHPLQTARFPEREVPKVTEVLIHKIHGGRKKDSKFWNIENDISISQQEPLSVAGTGDNSRTKRIRKANQVSIYSFATGVVLTAALFIGASFLLSGQENHLGKSPIYALSNKPKISSIPKKVATPSPPAASRIVKRPITRPAAMTVRNIPKISTTGKVFSWKDENGGLHFSNTNYPADNPTLQVQTEINKYRPITKIFIENNLIYIPVTLQNGSRTVTKSMLLDTGANPSFAIRTHFPLF